MYLKKRLGAALRAFSDPQLVVRPQQLSQMVSEKVSERLSDQALQGMLTEAVRASGEAETWRRARPMTPPHGSGTRAAGRVCGR